MTRPVPVPENSRRKRNIWIATLAVGLVIGLVLGIVVSLAFILPRMTRALKSEAMNRKRKKMAFQKTKTPIKCENCGYSWNYKGKLKRTTCPNCGNKTRITNRLETLLPSNPQTTKPPEDNSLELVRKYLEG